MAYNFLTLTNNVLVEFNEVPLTEAGFSSARGLQTQAKRAVNNAIDYINQREFNWPFNHANKTETLVAGQTRYTIPTDAKVVDYDTFRIIPTASTTGGELKYLDYKDYIAQHIEQEDKLDVGARPRCVFRTPDNNFGLYPYPDMVYDIRYEYFQQQSALEAATDVPSIPEGYRRVIEDGATAYMHLFRGEQGEYDRVFNRFNEGINSMRSLLSSRLDYIYSTVIHA